MYPIRRTVAAFVLGALIFGAPYVAAGGRVPTLAQVLASGGDTNDQTIGNGASYLLLQSDGTVQLVGGTGLGQVIVETNGQVDISYGGNLLAVGPDGVYASLPTSDPHKANVLWNDAGTVKVSAG